MVHNKLINILADCTLYNVKDMINIITAFLLTSAALQ